MDISHSYELGIA
ncbi:hypothetical protein MTR67_052613 [Solanum verrucosum]|uniref:Uncharacterized protein n=1 Tax=Solanum verrucosum TaxID=315347 RepID=A0AAF0V5E4_SOLVR|nr:hypothetical protein MTR67_052613 [Solanum verrucosum]